MLRNTSNNVEVGVRKRTERGAQEKRSESATLVPYPQKNTNQNIAAAVKNDVKVLQPRAPLVASSLNEIKPGRFAMAWAADLEECRARVSSLSRAIITQAEAREDQLPSALPKLATLTRELGGLLLDSAEARKHLARQADLLPRLVACYALLLSSDSVPGQEAASLALACMLQDPASAALVHRNGPALDAILAGLLRMVSGPGAASCARQRHAIFALQALTAGAQGQQRLMAVRRSMRLPGR